MAAAGFFKGGQGQRRFFFRVGKPVRGKAELRPIRVGDRGLQFASRQPLQDGERHPQVFFSVWEVRRILVKRADIIM